MSAEVSAQPATRESHGIARATAINSLGNIISRVLGLIRESMLANLFGTSAAMDAFRIAVIVPRGLYDLLIGGHVNSALVPVLSSYAELDDDNNLWDLISALISLLAVVMLVLVIGIELFAPFIIQAVASDASPAISNEATRLLRITAPALIFMSLFAVMSSLLYSLRRFTFPAFAASAFNLTIVITTFALVGQIGIQAAAFGWLLGAIVQLALQWAGLRGIAVRVRVLWRHPGVRTIALLYTPVMFSLALDVLINRPFSYNLASHTGEGSISTMDYATTLVQFPHGLVATAISLAVLPTLSRQNNNLPAFKQTLGEGLRLTLALIIPATIGLLVLATPVVALLFEHGEFTHTDTEITSLALRLYMFGLPFAAIDLLLVFAFYARHDTLTPALIGLLSLIVYMITALFLLPQYSFFALMIADSMKHLVHASVSGWLLMRRTGGLSGQKLIQTAARALLAAVLMGGVGLGLLALLDSQQLTSSQTINELMTVASVGAICGVFYLVLADWLGIAEIQMFFKKVRQKL